MNVRYSTAAAGFVGLATERATHAVGTHDWMAVVLVGVVFMACFVFWEFSPLPNHNGNRESETKAGYWGL